MEIEEENTDALYNRIRGLMVLNGERDERESDNIIHLKDG